MNDEFELTDEQLRLATTRSLPAGAALDPETAATRDDFVALGSALDSAAGQFDESALIVRLQKSCPEFRAGCVNIKRRLAARDWWMIALSGALAAAALVAVVRIASESKQSAPRIAVNAAPHDSKAMKKDTATAGLTTAWNDPLDDELLLAAAIIDQFASRSRGFDDSLLEMHERLDALSQELKGDAL